MKKSQRRKRIVGINHQQKMRRLAKRPQPIKPLSLESKIEMLKANIVTSQRYVAEDAEVNKFVSMILAAMLVLYSEYAFYVLWVCRGRGLTLLLLASCVVAFLSFILWDCISLANYWKKQLKRELQRLGELENLQLSTS